MTVFTYSDVDSWLRRRNPTAKLLAHLTITLVLTLVFDPVTPLAFVAGAFVIGAVLGRTPPTRLAASLLPFWLLSVSLVVTNALFVNQPEGATVIWAWGPFTATVEGALIGLSLAERVAAIAAFSVLFVMSTDPTDLVRSLVQQARVPPRLAYAALAGYRLLPALEREFETVRLAQRLRGYRAPAGPLGWWVEQRRLLIPVLAGAVRRTDRLALAMDSRGFAASRRRTHYRSMSWRWPDTAMLLGALIAALTILAVSAAFGILQLWTGALSV